jgi:PAS domain S-box-containing protein
VVGRPGVIRAAAVKALKAGGYRSILALGWTDGEVWLVGETSAWLAANVLPHLISAVVVFAVGAAILLYERFSVASRRFFVLAAVVAGWFATLAVAHVATEPAALDLWWGSTAGFQALAGSAVYWLAVHLTRAPRRRLALAAWVVGFAWFGWSVLRPDLSYAIGAVWVGQYATTAGVIGLTFILWVATLVAAAIIEFLLGCRRAATTADRRRHLAMLVAMAVGSLSLADYFFSEPLLGGAGISGAAVTAAIAIIGVAQVRYRTFAADAGFDAEYVLTTLSDAVLVCDDAGIVRIANPGALKLIDAGTGDVVGRPVSQFFRDQAKDRVPSDPVPGDPGAESVVDPLGVGTGEAELNLYPAHGPAIPVLVLVDRLRGSMAPDGWVVVIRDLREKLASERALAASELRYRSLFWHNPAIAFELDTAGNIVRLNPAAAERLGMKTEDMVGWSFRDLVAPHDLDRATAMFQAAVAGEHQQYELDVIGMAGSTDTVRGVTVPIIEGDQLVGVFGVALDVTAETRAKRELDVQRLYFAELFEGSPEAIAMIGEDGRIRRVNGEFTRLFGYTREEAVGQLLDDLIVPEEDREAAASIGVRAIEGRLTRAVVVRRRKEGGLLDVSVLARVIRIPGQEVQVYAIYRDVSEQKRTERKLQEREEELRHAQRLEAVGRLAGGVAHDFNNLLTVINGHVRLVLDETPANDRFRKDLEEIERAGVRAAALTQQLLAFSRRQVLRPSPLDLNAVVQDTERMLRRLLTSDIRLQVALAPSLPPVLADRGQVEQVLMNLVVNARDALSDGGTLTIRTDTVRLSSEDPRLEHWEMRPGRYVRLGVEDTGIGMAPEVLTRVFDPFFTTKDQGKGTGLGLATVFGIAKQSGGHAVAESVLGQGSRFTVYLPAATAARPLRLQPREAAAAAPPTVVSPTESDPAPSSGAGAGPLATVLVVEDEAAVRNLAVRVLERSGYAVIAASDGVEALNLAGSHAGRIDLVLSDLVMPEMGGRELARRIRLVRPSTRILLMSGYDDEMAAGGMDAEDFLPKPFTPAELAERVAAVLESRIG